jgi:hypothetical protein
MGPYGAFEVSPDQVRQWAAAMRDAAAEFDARHTDPADHPQTAEQANAYAVDQIAYALTAVMVQMQATMARAPLDLLHKWFLLWRTSDAMPAKLPDALHVDTSMMLSIANHVLGTSYHLQTGGLIENQPVYWRTDGHGAAFPRAGWVTSVHIASCSYGVMWVDGSHAANVPEHQLWPRPTGAWLDRRSPTPKDDDE